MVYALYLNDMRGPAENRVYVAKAETREELEAFMAREALPEVQEEKVFEHNEHYQIRHHTYRKHFREGPLEWYNPPHSPDEGIVEMLSRDTFIAEAGQRWDSFMAQLPDVTYRSTGPE